MTQYVFPEVLSEWRGEMGVGSFILLHYRTEACSAVKFSAVKLSAVHCSAVQFILMQFSAVRCSAVQCSAVQC